MSKSNKFAIWGTIVLLVIVFGALFLIKPEPAAPQPQEEQQLGAISGPDINSYINIRGPLNYRENVVNHTATTTYRTDQSGTTVNFTGATGTLATLPPVNVAGTVMRFTVGAAFATSDMVIGSAEGDNIEGTLIVAGAVVDCDGEDFINIIADGENVGDFVEVRSNGTKWIIGASGALTSAKMTCTDPS